MSYHCNWTDRPREWTDADLPLTQLNSFDVDRARTHVTLHGADANADADNAPYIKAATPPTCLYQCTQVFQPVN